MLKNDTFFGVQRNKVKNEAALKKGSLFFNLVAQHVFGLFPYGKYWLMRAGLLEIHRFTQNTWHGNNDDAVAHILTIHFFCRRHAR